MPEPPQPVVEPAAVTVYRLPGETSATARFTVRNTGGAYTECLVVTPTTPVHPDYQAQHWLGPATLTDEPVLVSCPVSFVGLAAQQSHTATVYVMLRAGEDEVIGKRLTVLVTPVGKAAPVVAVPSAAPPDNHPVPLSTRRCPVCQTDNALDRVRCTACVELLQPEKRCAACGWAFISMEKFCPKDGRKRLGPML